MKKELTNQGHRPVKIPVAADLRQVDLQGIWHRRSPADERQTPDAQVARGAMESTSRIWAFAGLNFGCHGLGVFDVAVQLGGRSTFPHGHVEDSETVTPHFPFQYAIGLHRVFIQQLSQKRFSRLIRNFCRDKLLSVDQRHIVYEQGT